MRYVIIATSMVLVSAAAVSATVYVVNPQGTGDFPTIQAAVDAVMNGDIIELTDGTFTGNGNRDIDFLGKAIIVCSQAGSPADCIINCQGSEAEPHRGFHFHSDEGAGSVVQDITIRNGWAWTGGGVDCEWAASPTFIGCTFWANEAQSGGGVHGGEFSTFTDCTFIDNAAEHSGGGMRGGTSSELIRCVFISNAARYGGGLYIRSSCSPTLDECAFLGNSAGHSGGGIHCELHCSPVLTNCTFRENHTLIGGGMDISIESSPALINCTFWGNYASYCGGISIGELCDVSLENTIIAFCSEGQAIGCNGGDVVLTCCDIYGNAGGDWIEYIEDQYGVAGNICEDPLFCDPEIDDFTLHCTSPCAPFSPPNVECDLIGAWPVGCGGTPVSETSWGRIKAVFRR
jgi:predicted outer membrane repeat protein